MSLNKTLVTHFNMEVMYWKLATINVNRINERIDATFFGYDSEASAHNPDIDNADKRTIVIRRDEFRERFSNEEMDKMGQNMISILYTIAKERHPDFLDAESI